MQVLIVYAHPEPQSFNGSMLNVALDAFNAQGHDVVVSDLYAQQFDPVAGPGDVISRKNEDCFSLGEEQMHASKNALFSADISIEIDKLLQADLENNEGADVDELKISSIYVDEGMTMKRLSPRAKGRADRILKRSCHITVKVADGEG